MRPHLPTLLPSLRSLVTLTLTFSAFTAACSLADAASTDNLANKLSKRPQVAAHQGGGFSPNANTLLQFREAARLGVDIIETDLRLSKDGVVLVFHDKNLMKNTNCWGSIESKTFAQIRTCKFNKSAEPIPTFEELLKWAKGKVLINAELKSDEVTEFALSLSAKLGMTESVFFQTTKSKDRYERARKYHRAAYLLYAPQDEKDLAWALALNDPKLLIIELQPNLYNRPDVMQAIHSHGKFATSNSFYASEDEEKSTAACGAIYKMGFDIATTDQPESCVKQRNRLFP